MALPLVRLLALQYSLPASTIITFPGKMIAINSLSSPTSVGRKISDVGGRGTPGYQRGMAGGLPAKRAGYALIRRGSVGLPE